MQRIRGTFYDIDQELEAIKASDEESKQELEVTALAWGIIEFAVL